MRRECGGTREALEGALDFYNKMLQVDESNAVCALPWVFLDLLSLLTGTPLGICLLPLLHWSS